MLGFRAIVFMILLKFVACTPTKREHIKEFATKEGDTDSYFDNTN